MVAEISSNMQQECGDWYYQQQMQHQHQQQQYFGIDSSVPLWSTYGQPTYLQYQQHHAAQAAAAYQQQQMQLAAAQNQQQQHQRSSNGWNSEESINNSDGSTGQSSPAATNSSGSDLGSPATPASPVDQSQCLTDGQYEWMRKSNYQPCPGKTRTKDKYRVVYTEHQRLELEKEFYSSKYITTNRKAELAAAVALSERQIKIWFQNRRAKERKMTKKCGSEADPLDVKPTIDLHGIAHAPPTSASPALMAMANLSLGNMSGINSLANNLQPTMPSSAALLAHHQHHHHHHPRINPEITGAHASHHVQHPAIGMWLDSSHV